VPVRTGKVALSSYSRSRHGSCTVDFRTPASTRVQPQAAAGRITSGARTGAGGGRVDRSGWHTNGVSVHARARRASERHFRRHGIRTGPMRTAHMDSDPGSPCCPPWRMAGAHVPWGRVQRKRDVGCFLMPLSAVRGLVRTMACDARSAPGVVCLRALGSDSRAPFVELTSCF
jgi:hypothetical protein